MGGRAADKALGMSDISGIESQLPIFANFGGQTVVHHGGRHHADPGVMVLVVVPGEEGVAVSATILETTEAVGKLGTVLHSAELAFGVGVVVGGVRPAVSFGHAEICQQQGHRLGSYGGAAVGVKAEGIGLNVRLLAGFLDKLFGQFGTFTGSQHPTHNVAAENIKNGV